MSLSIICRRAPDESANYFGGKLSDVRLYDYKLTAEEITALATYESLVSWCPDPADGADHVSLNADLAWNIPTDANEVSVLYKVYFGTDSALAVTPVVAGPLSEGEDRASVTNAQIGGPLLNGTYYWRVDSYDPNTATVTRTGDLWTFDAGLTPPVLIAPADSYAPGQEIDVDLEWSSDPAVVASRVYITPAGAPSEIDLGDQVSPFNPYAYGIANPSILTMAWEKNYQWRVVDRDAASHTVDGPTWVFRVRALVCSDPVALEADFDGDCIVNLTDFAVMASEWLDCNWDDGGKASPCP